jgi:hypothetical protein
MSYARLFTVVLFCIIGLAFARPIPSDPRSFSTNAKFSVDNDAMSLSSAVAVTQARPGAPGYSWLRINFYPFRLTAEDIASAANGNIESTKKSGTIGPIIPPITKVNMQ